MIDATREIQWAHPKSEELGLTPEEQKFTVTFRRPQTLAEVVELTGTEERLFDIIEQLNGRFINSKKVAFDKAADKAAALLIIEQGKAEGAKADLSTSRGTGNTAKAKNWDALKEIMADENQSKEAKLEALQQLMGLKL